MARLDEEERGLQEEEDEEDLPSATETAKKGRRVSVVKMVVLMTVTGILVTGGAFAVWYKLLSPSSESSSPGGEESTATDTADIGAIYHLDSFVANLSDDGGKRYLKVGVDLELSRPDLTTEVDRKNPALKDAVLVILGNKSYADISDARGKSLLREEIIARINPLLQKGTIRRVYFSEFVIQ